MVLGTVTNNTLRRPSLSCKLLFYIYYIIYGVEFKIWSEIESLLEVLR
jgi:hypothetical protein